MVARRAGAKVFRIGRAGEHRKAQEVGRKEDTGPEGVPGGEVVADSRRAAEGAAVGSRHAVEGAVVDSRLADEEGTAPVADIGLPVAGDTGLPVVEDTGLAGGDTAGHSPGEALPCYVSWMRQRSGHLRRGQTHGRKARHILGKTWWRCRLRLWFNVSRAKGLGDLERLLETRRAD